MVKEESVVLPPPSRLSSNVIAFSWTGSTKLQEEFIPFAVGNAREANKAIRKREDIPDMATVGNGLYLATDPLQSSVYGNILHCVTLRAGTTWHDAVFGSVPHIQSEASLLRYIFSAGLFPQQNPPDKREWAAVVRDTEVVDIAKSARIPFVDSSDSEPAEEIDLTKAHASLDSGNLCQSLLPFSKHRHILSNALLAASPQADINMNTTMVPLLGFDMSLMRSETLSPRNLAFVRRLRAAPEVVKSLGGTNPEAVSTDFGLFMAAFDVANGLLALSDERDVEDLGMPLNEAVAVVNALGVVPKLTLRRNDFLGLKDDFQAALRSVFDTWGNAHPEERAFGRRFLELLEPRSLRSLALEK